MDLSAPQITALIVHFVNSAISSAALIVSVLTFFISRRNIFGPKPIIRIANVLMDSAASDNYVNLVIKFEIWNLRKAPIMIRYSRIYLSVHRIPDCMTHTPQDDNWFFLPDPPSALYQIDHTVEPLKVEHFQVTIPLDRQTTASLTEAIKIRTKLFDGVKTEEYDISRYYSMSWDLEMRRSWRKRLKYTFWKLVQYGRLYPRR